MDKNQMVKALQSLDGRLKEPVKMLLGGGGAMVLAHGFPVATHDLDAMVYQSQMSDTDLSADVHVVAKELSLPVDWLNPHFSTFLYSLPKDYDTRLQSVFEGRFLTINALSTTDLLVLKCFAGRDKDIPHARSLIRKGADIQFVQTHIRKMIDLKIPKSQTASDFLDDLIDEVS